MKQVGTVWRRELHSYLATPIAVVFVVVFLILNGFFTFKMGRFFDSGQADLRPFFVWHPWLYLFIVPAISMRLWAEERKSGTIEMLLTLPVSLGEAMLGKFLAAWTFVAVALLLTFPIVLTVSYLGDPDLGVVLVGYLGSLLMAGTFLAIGCMISAATANQVISFVVTTVICLFLILIGFEPVIDSLLRIFPAGVVDQVKNLSFPFHFEALQRGVVDLRDVIYFLSLMLFSMVAGAMILERKKAD